VIEDGVGLNRRSRRFHRTSKLRRLVLIGRTGYATLEALRWLHDTGAALVHLDTNGELITTSVVHGPDLAGLRRAQALAVATPAGLEVARGLLSTKVQGQRELLHELPGSSNDNESIEACIRTIEQATTLSALLAAEAQAANAYWHAWSQVQLNFPSRETVKLPEHWTTFGQRASLITGAPRTATNPANAILNYLYALLEAETILACHAVGLDPGLGIFHTDRRDRASLALDLMEAARPAVDAYLLALLAQRTLSAREFVETSEGACRITPRLASELAAASEVWRTHIAPVVEQAAHTLTRHATSRLRTTTPLTGDNHKRVWDDKAPDRRQRRSPSDFAQLPNTCRECGALLSDHRRRYCDEHHRERFTTQAPAGRARAAEVLAQLRAEQRGRARWQSRRAAWHKERRAPASPPRMANPATPDPEVSARRSCPPSGIY
jgi:CRISPR-associated endonuclease Cas1